MNLDGFEVFDFSIGTPSFSATENGVTFDRHTSSALGYPEYIKVLINKEKFQIFLTPCGKCDGGIRYFSKNRKVKSVRINRGQFSSVLSEMSGLALVPGFRAAGKSVKGGVLFDLNCSKSL